MNASNFIKTAENKYYLFDFDCAGISYPINDIFAICNVSNTFVRFDTTEYDDPADRYQLLKQGYEKHRKLDNYDLSAMYSFIGLSCYWMAAQFNKYKSPLEGRQWLNENYFNNQYDWLMHWKKFCEAKNL